MPQDNSIPVSGKQRDERDQWYIDHPGADPARPETWNRKPSGSMPVGVQDNNQPVALPYAGFGGSNLAHNAVEGVKELGKGMYDMGKDFLFPKPGHTSIPDFIDRNIATPMDQEKYKSEEAYKLGHTSEGIGHGVAAAIPVLGPWAANLGEQAGTGDVGGAIARGGVQALVAHGSNTGLGKVIEAGKDFIQPKPLFIEPEYLPRTLDYADRMSRIDGTSPEKGSVDYKGTLGSQTGVAPSRPKHYPRPVTADELSKQQDSVGNSGSWAPVADTLSKAFSKWWLPRK